jgi:2-dehydro-3-deoxyphosphogluconate aldolase/(4S)-4-hydroxy-2-oxoglutarate aldolase
MNKAQVCSLIKEIGIIPAIRVSSGADAHFAAEAVTRGGIPIVEITMTVPGAVNLISHLAKHDPNTVIGA